MLTGDRNAGITSANKRRITAAHLLEGINDTRVAVISSLCGKSGSDRRHWNHLGFGEAGQYIIGRMGIDIGKKVLILSVLLLMHRRM